MHCFLIKCMYWIFFHFNLIFLIFCNKVYVFEICMKKPMCSLLFDLLSQLRSFSSPQFIFYYSNHEVLSMETEGLILVKTNHLRHHLGFPQQQCPHLYPWLCLPLTPSQQHTNVAWRHCSATTCFCASKDERNSGSEGWICIYAEARNVYSMHD